MRKKLYLVVSTLLFFSSTIFAQQREVTGKVTDESGGPLNGASIRIKNQRGGTNASSQGTFKISLPSNATLVISSVGYETREINVGNDNSVNVKLAIDAKSIGEVVVTGTGVAVNKKKVAIAVETVDIAKQTKVSTGGVLDQLVGQIAGAQISSVSGSPGRAPNILLRGINSIARGTTPMVILDGVQLGATGLNSIDLNTIERVEVVQGAAAATLYGAQGANGVIQLFSKRGKQGQLNIDVSLSSTTTDFLNIGGVAKNHYHSYGTNANNEALGSATNIPLVWNPAIGAYTDNVIYNALDPLATSSKAYDKNLLYYDHYKMFWQTGMNKSASLSISGGKEKMDFAITGSYNNQESNFKNNGGLIRGNFTSNIGAELFKNLKFRSVTQFIYDKNTVNWDRSIIFAINNTRPWANYNQKMTTGEYSSYFGGATGVNGSNPNYWQSVSTTDEDNVNIAQSFNLNYKFKKFLELEAKYGLNLAKSDNKYFYANQLNNPNLLNFGAASYGIYNNTGGQAGEIDIQKVQNLFQNLITSATINTDFEKDFHIKIPIRTSTLVAYDYRKREVRDYYVYGIGEPSFTPNTVANYTTQKIVRDNRTPSVTYGILANQRIEYGEIAGISAGIRSDYSSAFGFFSMPYHSLSLSLGTCSF